MKGNIRLPEHSEPRGWRRSLPVKDKMKLAAFRRTQFSLRQCPTPSLVNEGLVLHICDDLGRRTSLAHTVGWRAWHSRPTSTTPGVVEITNSRRRSRASRSRADHDPMGVTDPEFASVSTGT